MSIPTMTVTATSVAQLVGDGSDVGSEVDAAALVGMEFDFVCNIPPGTLVPGDAEGDVWMVQAVKGRVDANGVLCRVNPDDNSVGAPGVALLGADALNLTNPLQWKCRPGRVMINGQPVRPRSWWFNARPDGTSVPLRSLLPVEGTIAMPTVPDPAPGGGNPGGGGEVTEEAVVDALSATTTGLALVRAVNAAAVRDLIDAVTAAQLASAVQTALSNLVNGAPGALDSFLELAAAIGNDPTFAANVQSQVNALQSSKADAADLAALTAQFEGLANGLTGKVDKIAGKQLSTEDYSTADKTKLGTIAPNATVNATDAQLRDRGTHTGTQPADTITETAAFKVLTAAERTKLAGVADNATANASDAALRDRATHTGTINSTVIADLTEAVQDIVGAFLGGSGGITVDYNDAANTITIGGAGSGGGGVTAEDVRDTIGAALVGIGNISVLANDALDTITITTTATVNSTDAALRDRSTHTGTQSADTIVDGDTNKAFTAAERAAVAGIATAISNAIAAERSAARTLTNARINPRVQPVTNVTSLTVDSDAYDAVEDTGVAGNVTINPPTGTPVAGQRLRISITGTAARTLTFSTAAGGFEPNGTVALPTTTTGTNRLDTDFIWNPVTSRWRVQDEIPAASYRTGGTDVSVADGGTGRSSATAYALIAGGTNTTNPQQSVPVAASGFLKTTSTTALPSWAAIAAADIGDLTESVQDIVAAFITPAGGLSKSYDDANNVLTLTAAGGGNDARFVVFEADIGDGTANPIVVTHGLNTRTLFVDYWKTVGGVQLNPDVLQGQRVNIDIQRQPGNDRNAVIVKPDVPLGQGEFRLQIIGVVGSSDVTAPTAPTLAYDQVTATGFRVTPSGATDNVAVVAYNYFVNGQYKTTLPGAYTFAEGSPNTTYTVTATAIDRAGNESPVSVAVTPTTSGVPVAFANSSGVGLATASQANGSITRTVNVTKAGSIILAWYATTHVNGIDPSTGFGTGPNAASNVASTTLTKVASVAPSGSNGTLHLFVCVNPPVGTHTITMTSNSGGTWMDAVRGAAEVYEGVSGYNLRVTRTGGSATSATIAAAVAAALGNMAVLGIVHADALTALSGTVRDTGGAGINGTGDFLSVTDAPGEADGTVDFTSSNAVTHAFISVELVRAA